MLQYIALAQPSRAGEITSIASVVTACLVFVTAVIGLWQVVRLRRQGEKTNKQLVIIHDLVNSTLTKVYESDLEATRQSLLAKEELVALQLSKGIEPTPVTLATMQSDRVKIDRLTQLLADRLVTAGALLQAAS